MIDGTDVFQEQRDKKRELRPLPELDSVLQHLYRTMPDKHDPSL